MYQEFLFAFFYCQHLLRQGREAVIIGHELDVVLSEYSEEFASLAGHMVMPANVIIERSCITTVLLRTLITQMIFFNQVIMHLFDIQIQRYSAKIVTWT